MQVRFSVSSESQFLSSLSKLVLIFHNFSPPETFSPKFRIKRLLVVVTFGWSLQSSLNSGHSGYNRARARAPVLALAQPLQVTQILL